MSEVSAQPHAHLGCRTSVILRVQGRGLSAARPLGVEVEGSAAESPTQPGLPRSTGDPWKTKRPACVTASSYQFQRLLSTSASATRRPLLMGLSHFSQVCDLWSGLPGTPSHPHHRPHTCDPAATGPAPAARPPPRLLQRRPTGSAGAQTAASAGATRRVRGAGTAG